MVTICGVRFAPLFVPWHRRLETFAIAFYLFTFLTAPLVIVPATIYLLFFTRLWWLVLLYFFWFAYDRKTPSRGSRPSRIFRNWILWHWYSRYFPLHLVKTAELDANRNYIFACHPHGVVSLGIVHAFGTDVNSRSQFPEINFHICTLPGQFMFPLRREYVMAFGAIESSKESISYVLNRKSKGNAVVLVVGGAAEALSAFPGTYNIILKARKGFVRMALQTGADIVPVMSFGESDLYDQVGTRSGSILRFLQLKLKGIYTYTLPFFYGRGMFNYSFGMLPYRKPVFTVVGSPIRIDRVENPTNEEVDKIHAVYVKALQELFDQNKIKYGVDEKTMLNIIG